MSMKTINTATTTIITIITTSIRIYRLTVM
jgi:hypothetical protein